MRNYALALVLALICAPAISAFGEESDLDGISNATSGSDAVANSPLQVNANGFVLVNLTEAAQMNPIAPGNNSSVSRLILGENLSANLVQLSPGTEIKMHYHEGIEEAIWVVGGQGIINTGGMNYTIAAGDMLYLPVNVPSAMYVVGEEKLELVSLYAPPSDGNRTYV